MFHGADKAIEALLRGQESANRLKTVLEDQRTSSVSIEPLFDTLLDSFSFALSLFASSNTQPHCESYQSKATPVMSRKSPKKCYYRCAYSKDRNCNATKRVQQIQDSPSVYRTTYVRKHVCEVNIFSELNDDIANGSNMIRFDTLDQAMPDPVMPQPVQVEQDAIAIEEDTDQIMNLEFDTNELLVDVDDELWAYQFPPFSPGDLLLLDDLSEFDYNPLHI
ncbi:WRKY domain-containing protein [Hirschfeldia incana]|nr:WRKY domain-containing protein [Hirschfeldia incana]